MLYIDNYVKTVFDFKQFFSSRISVYPARRQMKPDIQADSGYQKRPNIRYNPIQDLRFFKRILRNSIRQPRLDLEIVKKREIQTDRDKQRYTKRDRCQKEREISDDQDSNLSGRCYVLPLCDLSAYPSFRSHSHSGDTQV